MLKGRPRKQGKPKQHRLAGIFPTQPFPAVRLVQVHGWRVREEWVMMYCYMKWRPLPHSIHLGRAQHCTEFGVKQNIKTGNGAGVGLKVLLPE